MSWISKTFNSSIGQKVIMALTGLFLCSFLIIHAIGNAQLFYHDQGFAFNKYALFMTTNPVIKTISYLLYLAIIYHAIKGLNLVYKNRKARPVGYAMHNGKANSHWTSRNMGVLGTILLVFIVVHMSGFWFEYKFGSVPYTRYTTNLATGETMADPMPAGVNHPQHYTVDGMEVTIVKDLYMEVSVGFKEWYLSLFYVLAMFAVSFHLFHGFKSSFQSMGLNHAKYNRLVAGLGTWIFAIILPITFAAMPLYFFFK